MKQYKVLKQKLKLSYDEFHILRFLSNKCNDTYNEALKNIKMHYEKDNKYINKYDNYNELSNIDEAFWLNNEIFQKTIFRANASFESFFKLLEYQKRII